MKTSNVLKIFASILVVSLGGSAVADTLADTKARGHVRCGVSQGLPGFSAKGRVFAEVAESYALIGNFKIAYELLGSIESDRFYKEGVSGVLIIQAKNDKLGARNLASKMLKLGGKIIDNKLIGKIAYAQAISGDIENSLLTTKKMDIGFDFSQVLINIASQISLQQANPLT